MKVISFIPVLILVGLIACNQGTTKKTDSTATNGRTMDEILQDPMFDESKVHGLGIFKIGASVESTIGQLVNSKNYRLDSIGNFEQVMQAQEVMGGFHLIFKIKPCLTTSETDMIPLVSSYGVALWCAKSSIYTVGSYEVDSTIMEKLLVKYYNSKLVYVECSASRDLEDAVELKFGKPETYDPNSKWHGYSNGDLEAGYSADIFRVSVSGAKGFIDSCGKTGFAAQNVVDKADKARNLKNL
jgi:hypothetical protein